MQTQSLYRHQEKHHTLNLRAAGLGKMLILAVVILIVLVASIWIYFNYQTNASACDIQLGDEIGIPNQSQCLRPVTIAVSSVNSSEFIVPVLVIRPGETGTLDILYHISASQVNHQGIKANITEGDSPVALSTSTSTENKSMVDFATSTLIFQNANWVLYKYVVKTSSQAAGYYAILPPFYYGFYPPLVVANQPNKLNNSALTMWGFTGIIQSGEFIIPSTIVEVTGFHVVNYTIPDISYCPNPACVLIARSLA